MCCANNLTYSPTYLQARVVRYREVQLQLNAVKRSLFTAYGGQSRQTMAGRLYLALKSALAKSGMSSSFSYQGIRVPISEEDQQRAEEGVKQFVADMLTNLDDRFPDSALLSALEIFDHRALPAREEWAVVGATYGQADVEQILGTYAKPTLGSNGHTFPAKVRADLFQTEWEVFREEMAKGWFAYLDQEPTGLDPFQQSQAREKFVVGFYAALFCQTDRTYREVPIIAVVWAMQCLSTTDCERGFSIMALIKTHHRNRMNVSTLNALMQIAINGPALCDHPAVQEIIEKAFGIWVAARKRNVRKSHPGVAGRKPKPRSTRSALEELGSIGRDRSDDLQEVPHE